MREWRACKITGADRKSVHYRGRRGGDADLRERLHEMGRSDDVSSTGGGTFCCVAMTSTSPARSPSEASCRKALTVRKAQAETARRGRAGAAAGDGAVRPTVEPRLRLRSARRRPCFWALTSSVMSTVGGWRQSPTHRSQRARGASSSTSSCSGQGDDDRPRGWHRADIERDPVIGGRCRHRAAQRRARKGYARPLSTVS